VTLVKQLEAAIADLLKLRVAELPELSEFSHKSVLHGLLVTGGPSAKRKVKPSLERTLRELHTIAEQASGLRAAFEKLGDPAASVFANRGGVRRMLRTLEIVAKDAAERMAAAEDIKPPHGAKRKIEPPNGAQGLALHCAFVFLTVTGEKPTLINSVGKPVHGPFVDFLRAVFKAHGVSSSLETSAGYAIKGMRRT
jgi:hypothetical protein